MNVSLSEIPVPTDTASAARAAADMVTDRFGVVVPEWRLPVLHQELKILGGGRSETDGLRRLEEGDEDGWAQVEATIAVAETYFFRHVEHFEIVRETAASLAASGQPCNVLSACCSTGEEAWSAAAVLADVGSKPGTNHRVVGWDLVTGRIRHARKGRYKRWACRKGFYRWETHFDREDDEWVVGPHLRKFVDFAAVNLADPLPADRKFDLIFFRNAAIYLEPTLLSRIVTALTDLLTPDGLLLPGPADPIPLRDDQWRQNFRSGRVRFFTRRRPDEPRPSRSRQAPPAAPHGHEPTVDLRSPQTQVRRRSTAPGATASSGEGRPLQMPSGPDFQSAPSLVDRVNDLADQGRYQPALDLISRERPGVSAEIARWEGILNLNLGNTETAVKNFRSCVYLQPEDPSNREWLAVAFESAGRTREAARERRNASLMSE